MSGRATRDHGAMSERGDVVRRMYEAVNRGEVAEAAACFAPDAVWVLPGRGPMAGAHRGVQEIYENFFARLGPLSGGTFHAELLDVAEGERYVVAVQRATAEHGGLTLDVTGCQLMTVEGGQITEVRGHYSDQEALDAFWSQ
jgi:ketosteroid isomerase-like protein